MPRIVRFTIWSGLRGKNGPPSRDPRLPFMAIVGEYPGPAPGDYRLLGIDNGDLLASIALWATMLAIRPRSSPSPSITVTISSPQYPDPAPLGVG